MENKKCSSCKKIKKYEEFYKKKAAKDGYQYSCKKCIDVKQKERNQKNPEKSRLCLKRWRKNNKEYVRDRDKKYRENNPEMFYKIYKKHRENNKEYFYLKGKKYREENRDYFLNKARERKYKQKLVSDGTITLEAENIIYELQNHLCIYCNINLDKNKKHLDHIIPLSRGGLHTISNVHWTCETCNLSKGYKLENEWIKSKIPNNLVIELFDTIENK